jgi:hypothetical protein
VISESALRIAKGVGKWLPIGLSMRWRPDQAWLARRAEPPRPRGLGGLADRKLLDDVCEFEGLDSVMPLESITN